MVGKKQDNGSSFSQENETTGSLAACYRSLSLVQLWREGRVREMRAVSSGPDFLHPVILELHAKASYAVLKEEGRQAEPAEVRHFIDCWLSFLFHPALFRSLPGKKEAAEQQQLDRFDCFDRQNLLEAGEKLVRKYAEQQEDCGERFIRHWEEDSALLKILSGMKKEEEEIPLYTPALAWKAEAAARILRLIQENQEALTDQEDFAAAGALFSEVGPALLLIRRGRYDAASNELALLKEKSEEETSCDPFTAYGIAGVKIACGLHLLNQGHYEEAENMLVALLPLPLHSSRLQQELLAALDREDRSLDPDWLAVSVHVLSELHRHCSVQAVKKALCSVLTRQAVLLHNKGVVDAQVLLTSMEKAVRLNPDDEFARLTCDDVRRDAEILALYQTMRAGKLIKASRIAQKSSCQGVVDQFFIFAAQVLEQVEAGDYPDDTSAFSMVRQLLEGALQVDPEHRMIREIALLLDELEEQLED